MLELVALHCDSAIDLPSASSLRHNSDSFCIQFWFWLWFVRVDWFSSFPETEFTSPNNFDKDGANPNPKFRSWYTSEIVGVNSRVKLVRDVATFLKFWLCVSVDCVESVWEQISSVVVGWRGFLGEFDPISVLTLNLSSTVAGKGGNGCRLKTVAWPLSQSVTELLELDPGLILWSG